MRTDKLITLYAMFCINFEKLFVGTTSVRRANLYSESQLSQDRLRKIGKSLKPAVLKPLSKLISLGGKKALITGAAAGIGKAIACRFAEAQADLELVDIDGESLKALRDSLLNFGVGVNLHTVDLSNKAQIDSLWEKIDGEEPDILVNNAGIYPLRNFLKLDEQFVEKVMGINLNSTLWMCQQMLKRRIKKGGVIINVGSIEAILPFREDLTHYDISKAGIIALTRSLAAEYGKCGFRINAILPGGIITSGMKQVAKELAKFKFDIIRSGIEFRQRLPLGRFGKPDEVALMVLVLVSDLSSYVQGTLVCVDGGFLSA
jgi:NAD(P)-dependent dehydrogenase (short-subunit alcohol dehydrogenase family)